LRPLHDLVACDRRRANCRVKPHDRIFGVAIGVRLRGKKDRKKQKCLNNQGHFIIGGDNIYCKTT